jgi:hypothetical protein
MPRSIISGSYSKIYFWFLRIYCVDQSFCCCEKIHEINNLRDKGFILLHSFRGFSPWSADSTVFRSVARQTHHGRRTWWRKDALLMVARKQRRDKAYPVGQAPPLWPTSSSKAPLPGFHHFPRMLSDYESIEEISVSMIQSIPPNIALGTKPASWVARITGVSHQRPAIKGLKGLLYLKNICEDM